MEEVIHKLSEEKDALESIKDSADITKEEFQARIFELENELEKHEEKLQVSIYDK